MSYTKVIPGLVRPNSDNIKRICLSQGRFRSTVASTQGDEVEGGKEKQVDECTVVKAVQADIIIQSKNTTDAQTQKIEIDFDNTHEAYKSKDNIELLRSLLVFKLCTFDFLVDKNKMVGTLF